MRFAVVGSGFAGLACAIELLEKGHQVQIFEKSDKVGGLASGFKKEKWNWSLEIFYHHIFANDTEIIRMAKKVGAPAIFFEPKTSSYINKKILDFDSPMSVVKFSEISFFSRLRMGFGLMILKLIPNGIFLEKYKVVRFLPLLIGAESYKAIWEKLLVAKFGDYVNQVNMAWFWSRVAKRTKRLGYFEGGFEKLITKMSERIKSMGGDILLNKEFSFEKKNLKIYDRVIVTAPAPVAQKITGQKVLPAIDYLWAQTLVLTLKKSLMKKYWLNILEKNWPFLVVVEHTRFVDKKYYDNESVVYFGNYLVGDNRQLKMTKDELIKEYVDFIKKINPNFKISWIKSSYLFRANYAQPVFPTDYSKYLKNINKKNNKVWFANMSMVYPYDRGTNYAIEIGRKVAQECLQ